MSRDDTITATPKATYAVLVTGANSGVGFAICCRLIDQFLQSNLDHLQATRLVLIITTRSRQKGDDTARRLKQHLDQLCAKEERKFPGITKEWQPLIEVQQEIVDLTSILSIQELAQKLLNERSTPGALQQLDTIICNAGFGGWTGVDYLTATFKILTNWVDATTYPSFKIPSTGGVTKPQIPSQSLGSKTKNALLKDSDNPPLGEVFCANVFGHYLLGHYLHPLMASTNRRAPARIVWISSLEAYKADLHAHDLQAIESKTSYESSKRLTDVLALTSDMRSVSPWTDSYFSSSSQQTSSTRPKHYLGHPGICSTEILPLPSFLKPVVLLSFYISRWLGSPWHTIFAYVGATAPVWLALAPSVTLEDEERKNGKGKWGSGADGSVNRTWVEAWGWGGQENEPDLPGKRKGAADITAEDRISLEEEGRVCWKQLEELRMEWERRLETK